MGKPSNDVLAGDAASATLPEGSLRELVNAGMVSGFLARGQAGGFAIEANLGSEVGRIAVLGNTRSGSRLFASLGTVALLLRKFGIDQFTVDATRYSPGRIRAARPDRSAAMKMPSKVVGPVRTTTPIKVVEPAKKKSAVKSHR